MTSLLILALLSVRVAPQTALTAPADVIIFAYIQHDARIRSVECILYKGTEPIRGSTLQTRIDKDTVLPFEYVDLEAGLYHAEVTLLFEDWSETTVKSELFRVEE
jgi:hypothetical protein